MFDLTFFSLSFFVALKKSALALAVKDFYILGKCENGRHLILDIRDRAMFPPVKRLGQLHVWDLGRRPVDLWRIVPS